MPSPFPFAQPSPSNLAQTRRRRAGVILPERRDSYAEEMARLAEQQKLRAAAEKEAAKAAEEQAREAEKAQAAAEKAALAEENNAKEAQFRREGRPMYMDAGGRIQSEVTDDEWKARQAQKVKNDQLRTRYYKEKRPFMQDAQGNIVPQHSDEEWQALNTEKAAKLEAAKVEKANQQLRLERRQEIDGVQRNLSDSREAVGMRTQELELQHSEAAAQAKKRADFVKQTQDQLENSLDIPADRAARMEQAVEQAQQELEEWQAKADALDGEVRSQKAAELAFRKAQQPIESAMAAAEDAIPTLTVETGAPMGVSSPPKPGGVPVKKDAPQVPGVRDAVIDRQQDAVASDPNLKPAERKAALEDLAARRDPVAYAALKRKRLAEADVPTLKSALDTEGPALESRIQDHQKRRAALEQQVSGAQQAVQTVLARNQTRLQQPHKGADLVTVDGPDGQPLSVFADLVDDYNAAVSAWQEQSQALQAEADVLDTEAAEIELDQQLYNEGVQALNAKAEQAAKLERAEAYTNLNALPGGKKLGDRLRQIDELVAKHAGGDDTDLQEWAKTETEKVRTEAEAAARSTSEAVDRVYGELARTLKQAEVSRLPGTDAWRSVENEAYAKAIDELAKHLGDTGPVMGSTMGLPQQSPARKQAVALLRDARAQDWSHSDTEAPVRYLSNGQPIINPELWLDREGFTKAVEGSEGSAEQKAALIKAYPELEAQAAKKQKELLSTMTVFEEWLDKQPSDLSDAEAVRRFRDANQGVFNTGAWKVRLNQALLGVAQGVLGIGQSVAGTLAAVTRADAPMKAYQALSADSAKLGASSAAMPTGQWVNMGTSMFVSTIPALVGGNLRNASALAGMQTFGQVYGAAVDGYEKQGLSREDALTKAWMPAAASGLATALLTKAGGEKGVEALLRSGRFTKDLGAWMKAVSGGMLQEGLLEEAPDQFIQGMIERHSYNPDKTWKQIAEETLQAGIGGALMGGMFEAMNTRFAPEGGRTADVPPQPLALPAPREETISTAPRESELSKPDMGSAGAVASNDTAPPPDRYMAARAAVAAWDGGKLPPERAAVTKAKAQVLIKIAEGAKPSDLEQEELMAVGLRREDDGRITSGYITNKGDWKKGVRPDGFTSVELLNDQFIITDRQAKRLREVGMDAVADAIALPAAERRGQIMDGIYREGRKEGLNPGDAAVKAMQASLEARKQEAASVEPTGEPAVVSPSQKSGEPAPQKIPAPAEAGTTNADEIPMEWAADKPSEVSGQKSEVPPEQMLPQAFKALRKDKEGINHSPAVTEYEHKGRIQQAIKEGRPVSAEAAAYYGLKVTAPAASPSLPVSESPSLASPEVKQRASEIATVLEKSGVPREVVLEVASKAVEASGIDPDGYASQMMQPAFDAAMKAQGWVRKPSNPLRWERAELNQARTGAEMDAQKARMTKAEVVRKPEVSGQKAEAPAQRQELSARQDWRQAREAGLRQQMQKLEKMDKAKAKEEFTKITRADKVLVDLVDNRYGALFDEVRIGRNEAGFSAMPLATDEKGRATRVALVIDPANFYAHGGLAPLEIEAALEEELAHRVDMMVSSRREAIDLARAIHKARPGVFDRVWQDYFAVSIREGSLPSKPPAVLTEEQAYLLYFEATRMIHQGTLTTETIQDVGTLRQIWRYLQSWLKHVRREMRKLPRELLGEWNARIEAAEKLLQKLERRAVALEKAALDDVEPPESAVRNQKAEVRGQKSEGRGQKPAPRGTDPDLDAEIQAAWESEQKSRRHVPTFTPTQQVLRNLRGLKDPDNDQVNIVSRIAMEGGIAIFSDKVRKQRLQDGLAVGGELDWLEKAGLPPFWKGLIFRKGNAQNIDTVMQQLHDEGYFPEAADESDVTGEMLAAKIADVLDRYQALKEGRGDLADADEQYGAEMAALERQRVAFERATADGPLAVRPADLKPGDVMQVMGQDGQLHPVEVLSLDTRPLEAGEDYDPEGNPGHRMGPDGPEVIESVTLKDGTTFGVQTVDGQEGLYVDEFKVSRGLGSARKRTDPEFDARLQSLYEQYAEEESLDLGDLVEALDVLAVETTDERGLDLGDAVRDYQDAIRENHEMWGGRGDDDADRDRFLAAVRGIMQRGALGSAQKRSDSSITPEQDAEYLAAMQAGDMDKAQRMVDAAAKAAGYDQRWFHKTSSQTPFDVFDVTRGDLGAHFGTERQATNLRGGTGGSLGQYFLRMNSPIRLKDKGGFHADSVAPQLWANKDFRMRGVLSESQIQRWEKMGDGSVAERRRANAEIRQFLVSEGYDGVVYANQHEGKGDSVIALTSSQIKSADPVTRDTAGNVIPLSQRFNPESDSILFSARKRGDAGPSMFGEAFDLLSGDKGTRGLFEAPGGMARLGDKETRGQGDAPAAAAPMEPITQAPPNVVDSGAVPMSQSAAAATITKEQAAQVLKDSALNDRPIRTYEQAVAANQIHMGTQIRQWSAFPFTGELRDGRPIQDLSGGADLQKAPTLFPSSGFVGHGNCEWCGKQPVKNFYHIKHDGKGWSLAVGSECIGHFADMSGDSMAGAARQSLALTTIAGLNDARRTLSKEFSEVQPAGYGRTERVWRNSTARSMADEVPDILGKITLESGPAAHSRWLNTKLEAAREWMARYDELMSRPATKKHQIDWRIRRIIHLESDLKHRRELPDYERERLQRQVEELRAEKSALEATESPAASPSPSPQVSPSPAGFILESVTGAQLDAEAQRKKQREEMQSRQDKPLVGTQGDIGQMDMLGGGDLFAQPAAKEERGQRREEGQNLASARKRPAQTGDEITDARAAWAAKRIKSPWFKAWAGKAKVFEIGDAIEVKPGKPVVIEGVHGTTHDFDVVDTSRGNVENDWGRAFYVSNNPEDVAANYAGEGPDLTNRIERRAEQIDNEMYDASAEDWQADYDLTADEAEIMSSRTSYGSEAYKKRQAILLRLARQNIKGHDGATMRVFVKLQNPLPLGNDAEPYWDVELDTEDDYAEPSGTLIDFLNALRSEASQFDDADVDTLASDYGYEGKKAGKVIEAARNALSGSTDPETGDLAGNEIVRRALESMGYDGIVDYTVDVKFGSQRRAGKQMAGMDENTVHVIAFDAAQVKSATGNRGTFSAQEKSLLFSARKRGDMPPASPFYSKLAQVIEQKMPNRADAKTIWGLITNPQTGIKQEELKWSGILPWLESQSGQKSEVRSQKSEDKPLISKAAVLDYLASDGAVRLEEVRMGVDTDLDAKVRQKNNISDYAWQQMPEYARQSWRNAFIAEVKQPEPKFAQYQLPGGENYREVVLAMPRRFNPMFRIVKDGNVLESTIDDRGRAERHAKDYPGAIVEEYDEPIRSNGVNYTSSHFPDVPNYVAHLRLNDREDAEGRPGTFIEEIQSDRHQAGREKGYKGEPTAQTVFVAVNEDRGLRRIGESREAVDRFLENQTYPVDEWTVTEQSEQGTIPDAPFRKDWPLQMFKRALADAVAAGKQWIGWTTGDTQAERYDLSKQVKEISATQRRNGSYYLSVKMKGQARVEEFDQVPENKLPDYVGKELAQKIVADGGGTYQGLDLKVGGEGMKGFYDTILPKEIGKYVKQWGAGVVKGYLGGAKAPYSIRELPDGYSVSSKEGANWFATEAEAKAFAKETYDATTPIWRVDITPAMRAGVEAGQALFASRKRAEQRAESGETEAGRSARAPIDAAAHEAATSPLNDLPEPTEAQREAGNYQKGHVRIAGHEISIENPAGSKRRPEWPALKDHYGYFKGTNAKDGDHVDVFVKPGTPEDYAGPVHVVRQNKVERGQKTGQFDEYKVMLGYPTAQEAREAYLRNYEPGWPGLHKLSTHSPAEFQKIKDTLFTVPADRVPGVREADAALASGVKRGQTDPMADPDKAAQTPEPSPGGLSEAEFTQLMDDYREVREKDKQKTGFWMSGPYWHVTNYTYSADSSYVTYRNVLGVEHQFRISNHEKPPGHSTDRYFRLQFVGDNNAQFRSEARKWISAKVKAAADLNLATMQDVVRQWHVEQVSNAEYALERVRERAAAVTNQVAELEDRLARKKEAYAQGIRIGNGKPFTTENQREQALAGIAQTENDLTSEREASKSKIDSVNQEVVKAEQALQSALVAQQKSQSRAESGSDMPGRGPTNLATSKTGQSESSLFTSEVNPESSRAADGTLSAAPKRRDNPAASPGVIPPAATAEDFARPDNALLRGMSNADWNRLDKGIKKRLDRILEPIVRYAGAKSDAAVEKMLDWVVGESLEGLEHAAGTTIEDVQQRKAAREALKAQARRAWQKTVRQVMPDATVPADVLAKMREMRAAESLSQEKALDVSKRALEGKPKLLDIMAGTKSEEFKSPDVRRKMYLAMNAKINSGVTMDDLTPEQRAVALALKQAWWENGMRRVRNGTLKLETFQDMAEGLPQYYEDDVNLEKGFIPRAFKMGLKGLIAQRSTRFHIVDKTSKDKSGEFALVNWTDPSTKRTDWKYKSKAHMDAAYEQIIEDQILAAKDARAADYGKLAPDDIRTLRQYTWMTDADRAALAGVTREKLRQPASLTPEQKAVVDRMTEQLHRRFQKKVPLTYQQHEKAGLIQDPFYSIGRALLESGHDNATAEFFNYIAKQPDYVRDVAENGFTAMPDDPKMGRLAGKWVRDDVAADLEQMLDVPNMVMRFYDALLAGFKYGHTILNLGSHVRNILGNVSFATLAGSNPLNPGNAKAYAEANKLLREGGPTFEALHKLGILGGDYLTNEVRRALRQLLPDPDTVERMIAAQDMSWLIGLKEQMARKFPRALENAGKLVNKGGSVLAAVPRAMENAWKWEDDIYKVAAFIKARQQGMSEADAAAHVRKWFPFYDKGSSGTLKALGRFVFPFLSFKRESLRIMGHALRERPLAFLTMMAIPRLLTQLSFTILELQLIAGMAGLGDDDEEDLLKDMKGKAGGLLAPFTDASLFSIALPWRDASGGMAQWDLSAVIPWSDWLSTRIEYNHENDPWFQKVFRQMVSGSPFAGLLFEGAVNKDFFSGKHIWEEDMSSAEQHQKLAEHIYMKLAPPMIGPHIAAMMRAMQQQPSKFLPARNPTQALMRILGVDIKPLSPDLRRKAEEFRKAHNIPLAPNWEGGAENAVKRARDRLYMELIQPEIDVEAANEAFAALEALGKPVRTLKELAEMFKRQSPETIMVSRARNAFVQSLPPESRRVYDSARTQQGEAFTRSKSVLQQRAEARRRAAGMTN